MPDHSTFTIIAFGLAIMLFVYWTALVVIIGVGVWRSGRRVKITTEAPSVKPFPWNFD